MLFAWATSCPPYSITGNGRDYSSRIPASRITFPHFAISILIFARKSAGVLLTIAHFVFAYHFVLMLLRLGRPQGEATLFTTPTAQFLSGAVGKYDGIQVAGDPGLSQQELALLVGVSGVAVVNAAAGSAPVYTLVPSVTKEYGLCFKCHSGYTQLLANTVPAAGEPVPYSRYALDKGIESNPANRSTHPIEGPGTNATAAMAESLAGSSPYKLWQFGVTDTVRCVDCHADSSRAAALAASPAGSGAALPPHPPGDAKGEAGGIDGHQGRRPVGDEGGHRLVDPLQQPRQQRGRLTHCAGRAQPREHLHEAHRRVCRLLGQPRDPHRVRGSGVRA